MLNNLFFLVVLLAAELIYGRVGSAAPKPADTQSTERDKAIKAFVAQVITAIGKKDIDTLVALSEVPFNQQPGLIHASKEELRNSIGGGLRRKPMFDGKHELKKIETYKVAKPRFNEQAVVDAKKVLGDDDVVVHVEVEYPDRKLQVRLLLKIKDGKPRLVGWGQETEDE